MAAWTADEALQLYRACADAIGSAGSPTAFGRASIPTDLVTYIIDRNVNYTNVCVARCNFCAFYRDVGSPEATCSGSRRSSRRSTRRSRVGGVQLLLQGGHNPDLPIAWYEDLFRAVKQNSRTSSCTRSRRRTNLRPTTQRQVRIVPALQQQLDAAERHWVSSIFFEDFLRRASTCLPAVANFAIERAQEASARVCSL